MPVMFAPPSLPQPALKVATAMPVGRPGPALTAATPGVCVCACVRACMRACVLCVRVRRVCVQECVRACVLACVCACVHAWRTSLFDVSTGIPCTLSYFHHCSRCDDGMVAMTEIGCPPSACV